MHIRSNIIATGCLFLLAALPGCGGGGGGSGSNAPPPPPTGGISRLGIALGPISNFGSIVVNGVDYDTSTATFTVEGGDQTSLRVGDVVTVTGSIDDNGLTGTADSVFFDDNVTGPVEGIDPLLQQLQVLGQTVQVVAETSFDDGIVPASIDGLSLGQIVEVSGQVDASGVIVATRIEPRPAGSQLEVHGIVSMHDATARRFNLQGLVVDYSNNAMLRNFPGGMINDGDFVEAKGAALAATGELLADEVEFESPAPALQDGDHAEIEGFITRFDSELDFDVAGFAVTTTPATVFTGGTALDLGLNVKVEAEGSIDAAGVLVAGKVDIRPSKAVRVAANPDSVDSANDVLVVLGITVTVDELTRFEDKQSGGNRVDPLTLADITPTDYVEIRGDEFPAGSGAIRATIFERQDPVGEATLQGFVEAVADPAITILGVTIETDAGTIFRAVDNSIITAGEFFSQVQANPLVKARGAEISATAIMALEVEFELEF